MDLLGTFLLIYCIGAALMSAVSATYFLHERTPKLMMGFLPVPALCSLIYLGIGVDLLSTPASVELVFFFVSLVCFLAADITLSFLTTKIFPSDEIILFVGVGFFLIGHLFNAIGFLYSTTWSSLAAWIVLYLFVMVFVLVGTYRFGVFRGIHFWGFSGYFLVGTIAAWSALIRFYDSKNTHSILPALGYVLFMLSDVLNVFGRSEVYSYKNFIYHELIVLGLYFSGVILLTVGVLVLLG